MNFKAFFDDTDAVSPVIGVILMVAITVILAAVIGTFVLGLGDQVQTTTPNVNIDASQPDTTVTADDDEMEIAEFEVTGGQTVDPNELSLSHSINGTNHIDSDTTYNVGGLDGSEVSAGTTISLTIGVDATASDTIELDGEEINLVWSSEGQSQTLSTLELDDVEVTSSS